MPTSLLKASSTVTHSDLGKDATVVLSGVIKNSKQSHLHTERNYIFSAQTFCIHRSEKMALMSLRSTI